MDITYSVLNRAWQISGTVTTELLSDLTTLGLKRGNFRETSDIEILQASLNNTEKIKRFIAGLTDTVGSLAPSHRHRTQNLQVISYEFTSKNFVLVSQITNLFIKINCFPNQILWNHPNFHSGTNRYYRSWKKGFKIRITLTDYMLAGSFVSEAKKLSATQNLALQNQVEARESTETVRINGRSSLHIDESNQWLPENIRGKHFVHQAHMNYFLGVPITAEALNYLKRKLQNPGALISPFTILSKGTKAEIDAIIDAEDYLKQSTFSEVAIPTEKLKLDTDERYVFGKSEDDGFPITQVIHAITYVALAQQRQGGVKGKRVMGNLQTSYANIADKLPELGVKLLKPDRGTCLIVQTKDYAALVGYTNDDFNNTLVSINHETLDLKIREPEFKECIVL